jgi:hypothetical protein
MLCLSVCLFLSPSSRHALLSLLFFKDGISCQTLYFLWHLPLVVAVFSLHPSFFFLALQSLITELFVDVSAYTHTHTLKGREVITTSIAT